jgi:hypothetical protein
MGENCWLLTRFDPQHPLTPDAVDVVEVDAEADLTESSVRGFVVVTQTCDLVRSCADRPFVEVAPLVAVDEWMVEITAAIGSV